MTPIDHEFKPSPIDINLVTVCECGRPLAEHRHEFKARLEYQCQDANDAPCSVCQGSSDDPRHSKPESAPRPTDGQGSFSDERELAAPTPGAEEVSKERAFREAWSHKPTPIDQASAGLWYSTECTEQLMADFAAQETSAKDAAIAGLRGILADISQFQSKYGNCLSHNLDERIASALSSTAAQGEPSIQKEGE